VATRPTRGLSHASKPYLSVVGSFGIARRRRLRRQLPVSRVELGFALPQAPRRARLDLVLDHLERAHRPETPARPHAHNNNSNNRRRE
jgi:hypothetical protein